MTAVAEDLARRSTRHLAITIASLFVALHTVFTRPDLAAGLQFDPAEPLQRPWAALTFPFVHDRAVHLVGVLVLLWITGPVVARRMGGRGLVTYYLYCALGAAALGVGLSTLFPQPLMTGGLSSTLGLALAAAWYAGDEVVGLDPFPVRVSLRAVVAGLAVVLLAAGLIAPSAGLSPAHLGGLVAGYLFLRVRPVVRPPRVSPAVAARRPVLTPIRLKADAPAAEPRLAASRGATTPSTGVPPAADDVNRVLDKISEHGIESLTAAEREILTAYAERKRRER
jgi:membrane associated rhomboid family serine protease